MSMTVGKKKLQSDINITPYIDILLVLLIIFMMVAPLKQHDHPIRIPQTAKTAQPKDVKPDSISSLSLSTNWNRL
jgi:biopolymer transport protein TolR